MAAAGTSSRGKMTDFYVPKPNHVLGVVVVLLTLTGVGVIFMLAHLTGAPTRSSIMASDGKPAWLIECLHSGDCIRESALTCPRGYDTVTQGASTEHTFVSTGKVMVPVDTFSGAMVIRCVGER